MPDEVPYDKADLLSRTSRGDVIAFREIFNRYHNRVFHIAKSLLHSDAAAEDAVQDIFMKTWLNHRALSSVIHLDAYLHTMTRNHIYNVLRRQALEQRILGELATDNAEEGYNSLHQIGHSELQRMLQKATATLSIQQRRVFEMSRLEGKKNSQIAAEMGLSRETVKKYLANALDKLRRYLVQQGKSFFQFFF